MKDRRGHGNQAILNHTDELDLPPTNTSYKAPIDADSEIGSAPEPIADEANEPAKTSSAPTVDLGEASATAPVASASAPLSGGENSGDEQASSGQPSSGPAPAHDASPPAQVEAGHPGPVDTASATLPTANASAGGDEAPNSYAGDDMGWDAVAFAEAGGYDAVLYGELPPGMCPGDGDGQDIFIFIDELNVDIVNNTLIQETEINLIADDGSVIDIGGDFTAIQTQESLIQDGPAFAGPGMPDATFIPDEASFIEAEAVAA